jgi:cyanophycinase
MGWIPFAAEKNTITSDRALADCFDRKITLERDMVSVPPLVSTITDSHFIERDRLGRHLTFMARTITDGWTDDVRGIGVDEATVLLVDADGSSTVLGPGTVSLVRMVPADVLTCARHEPLETGSVTVHVPTRGQTFDLATWSGGPFPRRRSGPTTGR